MAVPPDFEKKAPPSRQVGSPGDPSPEAAAEPTASDSQEKGTTKSSDARQQKQAEFPGSGDIGDFDPVDGAESPQTEVHDPFNLAGYEVVAQVVRRRGTASLVQHTLPWIDKDDVGVVLFGRENTGWVFDALDKVSSGSIFEKPSRTFPADPGPSLAEFTSTEDSVARGVPETLLVASLSNALDAAISTNVEPPQFTPERAFALGRRIVEIAASEFNDVTAVSIPLPDQRMIDDQTAEDGTGLSLDLAVELWRGVNQGLGGAAAGPNNLRVALIGRDPDVVRRVQAYAGTKALSAANDLAAGPDLLRIEVEVNALAETLLLRETKPPLSVGVLGGWGSGKSFVMHLMHQRMADIRSWEVDAGQAWVEDEEPGTAHPYVGHVYQVRFDAWTYAKADLWSSLMYTIFTQLNDQLTFEDTLLDVLVDRELESLGKRHATAEERRQTRQRVALAGSDIGGKAWEAMWSDDAGQVRRRLREEGMEQEYFEWLVRGSRGLRAFLDDITQAERTKLVEDRTRLADVQRRQAVLESNAKWNLAAGSLLRYSWRRIRRMFQVADATDVDQGDSRALWPNLVDIRGTISDMKGREKLTVAGVIGLIAALGVVAYRADDLLRGVTALGAVGAFVGQYLRLASRFTDQVAEGFRRYRDAVEVVDADPSAAVEAVAGGLRLEARSSWDTAAVGAGGDPSEGEGTDQAGDGAHRDEVQRRSDWEQYQALQREKGELRVRIADREQRIGWAASFDTIQDFVHSRLEEGDYEERLGLVQQVQNDLIELSSHLSLAGRDDPFAEQKRKYFPRGPARIVLYVDDLDRCPPKTVVDMLEATQLLLKTDLFVVVLAMDVRYITRALEERYRRILVRNGDPSGLDYVEKIIQIPYRIRPMSEEAIPDYVSYHMGIGGPAGTEADAATAAEGGSAPGSGDVLEPIKLVTIDDALSAEQLRFTPKELDLVSKCAQTVRLSPRAAKRLVNVYKLLKIVWHRGSDRPTPQLEEMALGLLALSGRYPEIMREAFDAISDGVSLMSNGDQSVAEFLTTNGGDLEKQAPTSREWKQFRDHAATLLDEATTLSDVEQDLLDLTRSFSFVGDIGRTPADQERRETKE